MESRHGFPGENRLSRRRVRPWLRAGLGGLFPHPPFALRTLFGPCEDPAIHPAGSIERLLALRRVRDPIDHRIDDGRPELVQIPGEGHRG